MLAASLVCSLILGVGDQRTPTFSDSQLNPFFRKCVATFEQAEKLSAQKDYPAADKLLASFWEENPAGTELWAMNYRIAGQVSRETGINIGTPPCYYALRMMTESVAWRAKGGKVSPNAAEATWTIVLVGKANGLEPSSRAEIEQGKGTQTNYRLEPSLIRDNHAVIRQSTQLFEEYVTAATKGELKVKLQFILLSDLDVPVESTWKERGFSGPTSEGWAQIWKSIPARQKAATDWWWVIYPSAIPEKHDDFKTTEFVTGGMGTGPDGMSPCFIIDDRWLTRKPPHLGRGPYTDLERRVYLPQWLQHEFFHHLFRIYPEFALEKTGHDWFNRSTWPSDFQGLIEPDYYAEALTRRFQGSQPSLAHRLLYAAPDPALFAKIKLPDLLGTYRHEPKQNDWHEGEIRQDADGNLTWTNQAGRTWKLTNRISQGQLATGPDCPYYNTNNPDQAAFKIVLQRDANGRHLPQAIGISFAGGFYRKVLSK